MIFGIKEPKFVSAGSTLLLDYTDIVKNEPEFRHLDAESAISGARSFYTKGNHWIFEAKVNLFKYDDDITKYEEIMSFLYNEGSLWMHRDGEAFMDSSSAIVDFYFYEAIPMYLNTTIKHDVLLCKFKSTEFVDVSKSVNDELITERSEEIIETEDGQRIVFE